MLRTRKIMQVVCQYMHGIKFKSKISAQNPLLVLYDSEFVSSNTVKCSFRVIRICPSQRSISSAEHRKIENRIVSFFYL